MSIRNKCNKAEDEPQPGVNLVKDHRNNKLEDHLDLPNKVLEDPHLLVWYKVGIPSKVQEDPHRLEWYKDQEVQDQFKDLEDLEQPLHQQVVQDQLDHKAVLLHVEQHQWEERKLVKLPNKWPKLGMIKHQIFHRVRYFFTLGKIDMYFFFE